MNLKIINSLSRYIRVLFNNNRKLIMLCSSFYNLEDEMNENMVLEIIQDIPRLIPYKLINDKLQIISNDGLMAYKDEIKYLENFYRNILKDNYKFLDKVRTIRNQYEHKMHNIYNKSKGAGTITLFLFEFEIIKNEEIVKIVVTSEEFIKLFKNLNILFQKILEDVFYLINDEEIDHPYIERLLKFNFKSFNDIYDCDLLTVIGRIIKKF